MSLSYEPLWEMLKTAHVSKMDFAKMINISNATLAKLGKNEPVTLTIIDRICDFFNCEIEDVIKHVPSDKLSYPSFPIRKGMIVLAADLSSQKTFVTSDGKIESGWASCPHVVLDIIDPSDNSIPPEIRTTLKNSPYYSITPIFFNGSPSNSPLELSFADVIINGERSSGYISLKEENIIAVSPEFIFSQLGNMPQEYMEKIENIAEANDNN